MCIFTEYSLMKFSWAKFINVPSTQVEKMKTASSLDRPSSHFYSLCPHTGPPPRHRPHESSLSWLLTSWIIIFFYFMLDINGIISYALIVSAFLQRYGCEIHNHFVCNGSFLFLFSYLMSKCVTVHSSSFLLLIRLTRLC